MIVILKEPKGYEMCRGCVSYCSPKGGCQLQECRWKHPYPKELIRKNIQTQGRSDKYPQLNQFKEVIETMFWNGARNVEIQEFLEAQGVVIREYQVGDYLRTNGMNRHDPIYVEKRRMERYEKENSVREEKRRLRELDKKNKEKKLLEEGKNAGWYEMYSMGLTDKEIAEKANVPKTRIRKWRNLAGLDPNLWNQSYGTSEQQKRIDYDAGLTDAELALKWSVAVKTVKRWRGFNLLPPNSKYGPNGKIDKYHT